MPSPMSDSDKVQVRAVLQAWAAATRQGRQDDVLVNHAEEALIYDVLPPMKYEGTEAYRQSWDEWQPDTQSDDVFDLEELSVTAGVNVAFATAVIRCGGTLPDGRTFGDLVRATFCLRKEHAGWKVFHQHISKPVNNG